MAGWSRDNPFARMFGAMVRRAAFPGPPPRTEEERLRRFVADLFAIEGNRLEYVRRIEWDEKAEALIARVRRETREFRGKGVPR